MQIISETGDFPKWIRDYVFSGYFQDISTILECVYKPPLYVIDCTCGPRISNNIARAIAPLPSFNMYLDGALSHSLDLRALSLHFSSLDALEYLFLFGECTSCSSLINSEISATCFCFTLHEYYLNSGDLSYKTLNIHDI